MKYYRGKEPSGKTILISLSDELAILVGTPSLLDEEELTVEQFSEEIVNHAPACTVYIK